MCHSNPHQVIPSTNVTTSHVTQGRVEYESTIPQGTDEGLDLWEAVSLSWWQQKINHKSLPINTRVGTLIVATIYLQLIQNRYMFQSFTVLQCSHQHCVQPIASDVEVIGYL